MHIKDRITELRRVPAADLLPNPKNWRTHPTAQLDALRGILSEVGIADALLARETENGLMLIDGHARTEILPDQIVPVLILDVTEEEADKLLASLDPLAAMAEQNQEKLDALLANMATQSDALQKMFDGMATKENMLDNIELPPATYEIIVECDGEQQQQEVYDRMTSEG